MSDRRDSHKEMRHSKSVSGQQTVANQAYGDGGETVIIQHMDTEKLNHLHELQSLRHSKQEWMYGICWFCSCVIILVGLCIWLITMELIRICAFIVPLTIFCIILFVWMCRQDIRYSNKIYDKIDEIHDNYPVWIDDDDIKVNYQIQDRCCFCNYKLFSDI